MIIYFAVPLVALLEGGILGNSKISIKGRNINIKLFLFILILLFPNITPSNRATIGTA